MTVIEIDRRSDEFKVADHILSSKHFDNQHQLADNMADRRLLMSVHDSSVTEPCGVHSQEVRILGKDYPSMQQPECKMLFVCGRAHPRSLGRQHIDAAATQPFGYGSRNLLIHVKANPSGHEVFQLTSKGCGDAVRPTKPRASDLLMS